MTRGGKRNGAGRKQTIPTKQVRIPVPAAQAIRQLADFYIAAATEMLHESHWYQTCPDSERSGIELALKGIEYRAYGSMIGGNSMTPVLVAVARHNGIGEEIEILMRLDKI